MHKFYVSGSVNLFGNYWNIMTENHFVIYHNKF